MSVLRHIWILPAMAVGIAISGLAVDGAARLPSPHSPAPMAVAEDVTPDEDAPAPTAMDKRVKNAVDVGLSFLVGLQQDDGSWLNDIGLKLGTSYRVERGDEMQPHIGVTALSCMALVAGGSTPHSGPYADNVRAGLKFLMSNQLTSGQFQAYGSRMYSHAFATLFMAEVYGMSNDDDVGKSLRGAVEFIVKNQVKAPKDSEFDREGRDILRRREQLNAVGGWRYEPGQLDADMSITVCQLQALRAARNVGIEIKREVVDSARAYVASNYMSYNGAFMYQPSMMTGRDTFALAACGVVALQSIGNYDSYIQRFDDGRSRTIDLRKTMEYLARNRPDYYEGYPPRNCSYGFWYGHYYSAQAFRQFAAVDAQAWKDWNDQNRRHFLAMQQTIGSGGWEDEIGRKWKLSGYQESKNAYATAMACLILSISNEYLPIFQR